MALVTALLVSAVGTWGCSGAPIRAGDGGGVGGNTGSNDASGNGGNGGANGSGGSSSTGGRNGGSGGISGNGGYGGLGGTAGSMAVCTPGVQAALILDCGYPYKTDNNPLTSIVFNESEVLRAIMPSGSAPEGVVRLFYNDEHALTLGVRQVAVKTGAGAGATTMTDFPVSPLATDPGSVTDPKTGSTELAGDNSGLDQSLRPMWPALFVTDITANPADRSGDWQMGGRPRGPNAVFGSWKAAVRTVDKSVTPSKVSITPDPDPAKNKWELAGGDPAPAGLTDQGFGAEARWSVPLSGGHNYRIQVMVHDGDQNKGGGDSGEACVLFCAGGPGGGGTGGAGGSGPPPPMCPAGAMACGQGGIDPVSCPAGTVCANGCCLMLIP
jgi:hypothetical protein